MARALHLYERTDDIGQDWAACGHFGAPAVLRTTEHRHEVTCALCRRVMEGAEVRRERRVRRRHEQAPAEHAYHGEDRWFRSMTREPLPQSGMTRAQADAYALAFSQALEPRPPGDYPTEPRPERFGSVAHALATLLDVTLHGYGMPSVNDDERLRRLATGVQWGGHASDTPRQAELAHDVHHVRAALTHAYSREGWDHPRVDRDTCGRILLLRVVGRKRAKDVAELVEGLDGALSPKAVGRISRWGRQRVYEYLRERGLVPQEAEAEETRRVYMAEIVGGFDIDGWAGIADALGVTKRTAERWADRHEHPLPVHRIGGRVRARTAELEGWLEEEAERNRAGRT